MRVANDGVAASGARSHDGHEAPVKWSATDPRRPPHDIRKQRRPPPSDSGQVHGASGAARGQEVAWILSAQPSGRRLHPVRRRMRARMRTLTGMVLILVAGLASTFFLRVFLRV